MNSSEVSGGRGPTTPMTLPVSMPSRVTKMATTPAQWLQAFASLYANYSPAAWLKEWRNGIADVRRKRLEVVTGRKVGETATEMQQELATEVANDVKADAPTTAGRPSWRR